MRRALLLLCLAWIAACARGVDPRLTALVGQSEADVVRQLGVPTKVSDANGRRYMTYDSQSLGFAYNQPQAAPWGTYQPLGYDATRMSGSGIDTRFVPRACDTTFEIEQGRVRSVSQSGDGCR